MKKLFLLFTSLIFAGCTSIDKQIKFEETLGHEKYQALKELVDFFDEQIKGGLREDNTEIDLIENFLLLSEAKASDYLNVHLPIDTVRGAQILESIERSGLQNDIWLELESIYPDSSVVAYYKNIINSGNLNTDTPGIILGELTDGSANPIGDTTRINSPYSALAMALYESQIDNDFIENYCENKFRGVSTSKQILALQLQDERNQLNNFFIKSVIVTELYYHFLYYTIYKRTAPNMP